MNFKNSLFYVFIFLLLPKFSIAQLSGVSLAYGNCFKSAMHEDARLIRSNYINAGYHQYLHRFWSGSVQVQYAAGKLNDPEHFLNPFSVTSAGATISYWYLSDIRLLSSNSRKSCKGRLVALSYNFKSYLTAGINGNWLNSPSNDFKRAYLSYSLGIGFNLWQFSVDKQPMVLKSYTKYLLIPFINVMYINSIKEFDVGEGHDWRTNNYEVNLGIKFGFTGN